MTVIRIPRNRSVNTTTISRLFPPSTEQEEANYQYIHVPLLMKILRNPFPKPNTCILIWPIPWKWLISCFYFQNLIHYPPPPLLHHSLQNFENHWYIKGLHIKYMACSLYNHRDRTWRECWLVLDYFHQIMIRLHRACFLYINY